MCPGPCCSAGAPPVLRADAQQGHNFMNWLYGPSPERRHWSPGKDGHLCHAGARLPRPLSPTEDSVSGGRPPALAALGSPLAPLSMSLEGAVPRKLWKLPFPPRTSAATSQPGVPPGRWRVACCAEVGAGVLPEMAGAEKSVSEPSYGQAPAPAHPGSPTSPTLARPPATRQGPRASSGGPGAFTERASLRSSGTVGDCPGPGPPWPCPSAPL